MKGFRVKEYPVPKGTKFEEGGETFTIVGPLDDQQFVDYSNRWPKANRQLRDRPDNPFMFSSGIIKIWAVFDEHGYPVSKSGLTIQSNVIGDGGSYTVGGFDNHSKKYGTSYLKRGFFKKLQKYRIPYAKEQAEAKNVPLVFSLQNDEPWRKATYIKLGFEVIDKAEEKHSHLPEDIYEKLKKKNRTYCIWLPDSLKVDKSMKKIWGILNSDKKNNMWKEILKG
tara:strand:+ start:928 stop:1599 length:672 start_codon:yes stop_codon:yes gene_type:complete